MSQLTAILSQYWSSIQGTLFPWLREELDPLTQKQQQLIEVLEVIRVEEFSKTADQKTFEMKIFTILDNLPIEPIAKLICPLNSPFRGHLSSLSLPNPP